MTVKPVAPTKYNTPEKPSAIPRLLVAKEVPNNLNPPSFTYPPELTVAPRGPNQSFFSYIWRAGRAYLSFYKSSITHVRETRKVAKSMRQKAIKLKPDSDVSEVTSRAVWQIITRSRKDLLRLPAFGLILLICGEWTPLLVFYMTPLVPEACRIPTQVERELKKTESRRHERLRRARLDAMRLAAQDRSAASSLESLTRNSVFSDTPQAEVIRKTDPLKLSLYELVLASARYDCHWRIWDRLFLTPPKFLLQHSVRRKFGYLRTDDRLIKRDGGYHKLEKREVERACIERGIDVLGKQEKELRKALAIYYT